ncbi:leucyl aminopeptidase [Marinimicrobium sp. ABcell2]|uniref:leucyl aminopeptidase n=1 Tax=Marinimicrobium sp. ABcell2 TaxID=3069751 RepID=UPI0027B8407D|nr:leucyl aminopeptidase [Marinimicrobium sp. ABcell2]MDQ2077242.1 leucyl aminopeptidase [Marinimicrobium sp. ABcell2]
MSFTAKVVTAPKQRSHCLVVAVYEGGKLSPSAQAIEEAGGQLGALCKREGFKGKAGQTLLLLSPTGISAERLLVIGMGKAPVSANDYRKAVDKGLLALKNTACKDLCLCLGEVSVKDRDAQWQARQVAELLGAQQYRFTRFKSSSPDDNFAPSKIVFGCQETSQVNLAKAGLETGAAVAKGVALARELGDLPGNVCTPTYLANEAKQLARGQTKLSVKVLEEKQMKELGMGSLLSVSAGSEEPAKLIVMTYQGGAKSAAPVALVGKGITFDTGGISLKPGQGMDEMKYDMCGAASVLGTMKTLIELQAKINVVAIVAAAENMPDGRATKPGDIVTSMSGQTIEILNTDAEGRLVLCDALTYSARFKPKAVVDVATLTGACVIALGSHATGLYSNEDSLAEALLNAGEEANDRAWRMPLWDEYQKQLDSNFADIANIGGREAGSVTAACFLSRFVKKTPWAHLDVAGTAWRSGANKGATGRPVSLLVQYLLNQR